MDRLGARLQVSLKALTVLLKMATLVLSVVRSEVLKQELKIAVSLSSQRAPQRPTGTGIQKRPQKKAAINPNVIPLYYFPKQKMSS